MGENKNEAAKSKSSRIWVVPYILAGLSVLILLVLTNLPPISWISGFTQNYLSVHVILEFVCILVSFGIFTVGWATYHNARGSDILILSVASMAVGLLDFGHTLTFTGMPDFFGPSGPNKAIDFWFASRFTGCLAFLWVSVSGPRQTRFQFFHWLMFVGTLIWVGFCYWLIMGHLEELPEFFVAGRGLTFQKILIERTLAAISIVTAVLLFARAEKNNNTSYRWMGCACFLYGICGCFFTLYRDFEDIYNFAGHIFKTASFLLLYRAVFIDCVSRPYENLQVLARQAVAANSSKSRFLANVSHEFRTPLGVIMGFSDLMINSGRLDSTLENWANMIARNAKQLGLLIDDLLGLANTENDKITAKWARFDIAASIQQITEGLDIQAKSKDITLKFETLLARPVLVVNDELRVRQMLMNLIGNAIKFTDRGRIVVTLNKVTPGVGGSAGSYEILIKDSGVGIDEADAKVLFQLFSQVGDSESRKFGGTGLGLLLSKKIAEALGGSISLLQSSPEAGSLFRILLLDQVGLLPKEEVNPAPVLISSGPPKFTNKKVLIAEDSEDNQLLLRSYLRPTGIEIVFANNGVEAVNLTKIQPFDVILMDIQMPVMDGFEAAGVLRRLGWQGQIIALTAHVHQPERERAMRAGFNDYLVKPINKEYLWSSLQKSFTRSPTDREDFTRT